MILKGCGLRIVFRLVEGVVYCLWEAGHDYGKLEMLLIVLLLRFVVLERTLIAAFTYRYHHMSNGTITFVNSVGRFDLDVTTFQMAVLFAWNQRPLERIAYENLRLATELPDAELRKTLWSLVAFPKLKRQLLCFSPAASAPKDFSEHSLFWVNQDFSLVKNGKPQKRGKINLIGRLQLSTERSQMEENQSIVQLRILRTQEAITKILKMRKRITNVALQAELIDILKNMFLPSKKMIKEQLEWLIEHKYMRRDDDDINTFIYMA